MTNLNQSAPFSPEIATKRPEYVLWVLANSIKINNRANFSLQEMIDSLGFGKRSIQRYMSSDLFYHKQEQIELGFTKESDYVFHSDKNLYFYDESGIATFVLFPKPTEEVNSLLGLTEVQQVIVSPELIHRSNIKVTTVTSTEFLLRTDKIAHQQSLGTDKLIIENEIIFSDVPDVDGILNTDRKNLVLLDGDRVNTKVYVTQQEIANRLGRSLSFVSKTLKSAKLDTKIVYSCTDELNEKVGKHFKKNPNINSCFIEGVGFVSIYGGHAFKRISNIYNNVYEFFKENVENVETVVETIKERIVRWTASPDDLSIKEMYHIFKDMYPNPTVNTTPQSHHLVWKELTELAIDNRYLCPRWVVCVPTDLINKEVNKFLDLHNEGLDRSDHVTWNPKEKIECHTQYLSESEYHDFLIGREDVDREYEEAYREIRKVDERACNPEKAEYYKEQDEKKLRDAKSHRESVERTKRNLAEGRAWQANFDKIHGKNFYAEQQQESQQQQQLAQDEQQQMCAEELECAGGNW